MHSYRHISKRSIIQGHHVHVSQESEVGAGAQIWGILEKNSFELLVSYVPNLPNYMFVAVNILFGNY